MPHLLILLLALVLCYLALSRFAPRFLVRSSARLLGTLLGFKRKQVDVDGYTWHYLDNEGKPGQEVIVMVHGFGGDKEGWLAYARFFRRDFRVIAMDLPAFGENLPDESLDYTPRLQARRLVRFLDTIGLERAHLVGNSMGGLIIKHLGIDAPEVPSSLLFMNSAGVASDTPSPLELAVGRGENPLVVKDIAELESLMALVAHRDLKLPGFYQRHMANLMRERYDLFNRIFWNILEDGKAPDLSAELPKITAPVLILWGEHDQLLDVSCAHGIKRQLPNAELVIFDDVGHVPFLEVPKRAAHAHRQFLQSLSTQGAAIETASRA
jgi:abhydrolase domain-containing protein 6